MGDERTEISTGGLVRWALVGAILLAAVGAFFAWAPHTPAVLAPHTRVGAP
jgi:hypothetical protein